MGGDDFFDAGRDRQRLAEVVRRGDRLAYARASSSAKNGLPSVASARRISTGRGSDRSRRLFTSWYRAASERDWGAIRSRLSSENARDSPSGSSPPGPARLARSRPSRGGSRRNANVSACSVAGSSHCTSSMATSTGSRSASAASTLTRAVPVSRPSALAPGSARRSAEASARSWMGGQRASRIVEPGADEVGERDVREVGLALGRPGLEDAEVTLLGEPQRLEPDRRLPISLPDPR